MDIPVWVLTVWFIGCGLGVVVIIRLSNRVDNLKYSVLALTNRESSLKRKLEVAEREVTALRSSLAKHAGEASLARERLLEVLSVVSRGELGDSLRRELVELEEEEMPRAGLDTPGS